MRSWHIPVAGTAVDLLTPPAGAQWGVADDADGADARAHLSFRAIGRVRGMPPRAGSAAGRLLCGLGDQLAQGGLAGRIVGLFAAGEVEEQVHELGGRRIAAGDLRRCRRGEEQQRGQRRTGEADRSHARIPSVAPGSLRLEQVVAAEQSIGLVSRPSAASALARAEREPGPRATRRDASIVHRLCRVAPGSRVFAR